MAAPHERAEDTDRAAPPALSPEERRRAGLCRFLIYAAQVVTAAISVGLVALWTSAAGRATAAGPWQIAFGVNAILGAFGGAAAVILFWPVSRERWFRAAACLVFCPVIHLGAIVALTAVAGCLGLIR